MFAFVFERGGLSETGLACEPFLFSVKSSSLEQASHPIRLSQHKFHSAFSSLFQLLLPEKDDHPITTASRHDFVAQTPPSRRRAGAPEARVTPAPARQGQLDGRAAPIVHASRGRGVRRLHGHRRLHSHGGLVLDGWSQRQGGTLDGTASAARGLYELGNARYGTRPGLGAGSAQTQVGGGLCGYGGAGEGIVETNVGGIFGSSGGSHEKTRRKDEGFCRGPG